jgi:NTP pyrophosphatase (non-canonical NTP hydrolase)
MKMSDEHIRLMEFVRDCIVNERHRQTELYGIQRHEMTKWLAILVEEVGEVAQAMQQGTASQKQTDADNLFDELIQVAAVAAAMAEQIKENQGWV